MERPTSDSTLRKWEAPTFTQVRVSAEVTAYVAVMGEAD